MPILGGMDERTNRGTADRAVTIPADAILTHGAHEPGEGTCARELLHLLVTGEHRDATPECLTACCASLPPLNDSPAWRDDQHRTDVLLPYLARLAQCPRDAEVDQRRAYRLADIAVRVIAADALDAAGIEHDLRELTPVRDRETAEAAAGAARDAAEDAEVAAEVAAEDAADAAEDAARAAGAAAEVAEVAEVAGAAAWAARTAAGAAGAAAIERYARLLLDAIVEEA